MVVDRELGLLVLTKWIRKLKPVIEASKAVIAKGLRKRLIRGIFALWLRTNVAVKPTVYCPYQVQNNTKKCAIKVEMGS